MLLSVATDPEVVTSPLRLAPAVARPFAFIVVEAYVPMVELTVASVSAPPAAKVASPLITAGPRVVPEPAAYCAIAGPVPPPTLPTLHGLPVPIRIPVEPACTHCVEPRMLVSRFPVSETVVKAAAFGVVPPKTGGDANSEFTPAPDNAPLIVTAPVNDPLVKLPDPGFAPPILPGEAKSAPFNLLALRLATTVDDDTTKGGRPVASVDVICPLAVTVVVLTGAFSLPAPSVLRTTETPVVAGVTPPTAPAEFVKS